MHQAFKNGILGKFSNEFGKAKTYPKGLLKIMDCNRMVDTAVDYSCLTYKE